MAQRHGARTPGSAERSANPTIMTDNSAMIAPATISLPFRVNTVITYAAKTANHQIAHRIGNAIPAVGCGVTPL